MRLRTERAQSVHEGLSHSRAYLQAPTDLERLLEKVHEPATTDIFGVLLQFLVGELGVDRDLHRFSLSEGIDVPHVCLPGDGAGVDWIGGGI